MSLILGDCFEKLDTLENNSVDLIYLDPPFFTQRTHKLKDKNNKEYFFEDSWLNVDEYKLFVKKRLYKCKNILKDSGSIFLHCDKSASHHLRIILDEVFGVENFKSEIIWTYKRWSNSKKGLLNSHQNIYFYSKTNKFKFNRIYTDYSLTTNIDQILQKRGRGNNGKSSYMKDSDGSVVLDVEKRGVPLSDVWDIPYLNPKAKERIGYPTQKPILLLEKIIGLVTDVGDTVLDPFCGSGTTLVASKLLNRKYIGIDISKEAIDITNKRLEFPVKTNSNLLKDGKESYQNKSEYELNLLKEINAIPVQRNKGIDGLLKYSFNNLPISVKIQRENEKLDDAINELVKASKKKKCSFMILIKTNNLLSENYCLDYKKEENLIIVESYKILIDNIIKS